MLSGRYALCFLYLQFLLPFRATVFTIAVYKIALETRNILINYSDNILFFKQGKLESGRARVSLEASVPGPPSGCHRGRHASLDVRFLTLVGFFVTSIFLVCLSNGFRKEHAHVALNSSLQNIASPEPCIS